MAFSRNHLVSAFLLTLLLLVSASAADARARRPNILIFVADDLGWGDVSWNNPAMRTPNLDKLCRSGVRLDQHYVASMCTPTRVALLTGRFPTRFGISLAQNEQAVPFETVTLASALKQAGYDTAIAGKWHLGSLPKWGPQHFGFDSGYGLLAGGCGPYSHLYKAGPYARTWHRQGALLDENGHVTDLIADEAIRWLNERGERPFFLYVPFTAPHVPVQETEKWRRATGLSLQDVPEAKLEFYAAIAHMDDAVGRIMAALRKTGRDRDTIVIFTSDNGATPDQANETWMTSDDPRDKFIAGPAGGTNAPLRGKKTTVYEGGIRVPAFVVWPGRLQPGIFPGVMHAVDWMPTLTSIAGYRAAKDLKWDGRDMLPAITGETRAPERQLYWVAARWSHSAVRDGDWKLVVAKDGSSKELFNLAKDPSEKDNLASREPSRVAALQKLHERLSAADNDAKVGAASQ
jgi:arylsulfatase A-like enzyme